MDNNLETGTGSLAADDSYNKVKFSFHGKTGEFFGIWIVNVLLSILTLGIYSAWANVRTNRYLYSNTELDDNRFSYLATPMQILKGRIIAIILFAAYYTISMFYPVAHLIFAVALLIAFPFLICSSIRFNMRMTSYRNVRFDFVGGYWQAALNFILLPILSVFTFYLLLPYVFKRMDAFIVGNIKYGNKPFITKITAGTYYLASLMVMVLSSIVMVVVMALMFALVPETDMANGGLEAFSSPIMVVVIVVFYVLFFTFIQAIYRATIRNHLFKETQVEGVAKFDSSFTFVSLAMLQITNLLALLCTLGLAYPWTLIRTMSYSIERTKVFANDNKEQIIDELGESPSAITDEVANVFDLDVAII